MTNKVCVCCVCKQEFDNGAAVIDVEVKRRVHNPEDIREVFQLLHGTTKFYCFRHINEARSKFHKEGE